MPEHLYHFSENPSIDRFAPRIAPTSAMKDEAVWAVDAEHAHLYYFPRDCPRVHFAMATTTPEDRKRFLGLSTAKHVAAIEIEWLSRLRSTKLFRYRLPPAGFELVDEHAGYWIARHEVRPLDVEPLDDLLDANVAAGVELRIMPSLWPLYEAVIASTLEFSIIRWRNAGPKEAPHDCIARP